MAISRMDMERQLRNMGGIMTLEEPRQGYFLGKIVRKAKKAVKKVVKSPLGKIALGAAALKFGGPGIAKLLGRDPTGFLSGRFMGDGGIFSAAKGLFDEGNLLSGLVRNKEGEFDLGRAALTGLGATAIAAPFFMGGDEEVVDEGVDVTGIQPMVANIRQQARDYYQDPTKSALYFMPPKSAVQSRFFAEGGGLADIPREGYSEGESVIDLSKDPNYKGWLKLYETNPDAAEQNENHAKYLSYYNSSKNQKAEGGIMDLGGMEKDYREGGFVPIGAEERADDVPARLSKNEFVFTADAVRNAGGGDIDKGAEVMQNMMDNLEAGGMISEESQGKENPAQAMFDQAQMLEGRLA
jgi:hypothetical protein